MKPPNTREEIEQLYHLPLIEAAHTLGISTTLLKKRCRAVGIESWPYKRMKKSIPDNGPINYNFREWVPKDPNQKKKTRVCGDVAVVNSNASSHNHSTQYDQPKDLEVPTYKDGGEKQQQLQGVAEILCLVDGTIVGLHDSVCSCLGYDSQDDLMHLPVQYLLHPGDILQLNFTLLQCMCGYSQFNLPLRLQRTDLAFVEVQMQITCFLNTNNICTNIHLQFECPETDLSEQSSGTQYAKAVLSQYRIPRGEVASITDELQRADFNFGLLWLLNQLFGKTSFISENTYKHSHLAASTFVFPMEDPIPSLFHDPKGRVIWSNRTYDVITGYNHKNEDIQEMETMRSTFVHMATELMLAQLPERFELQTPLVYEARCGIRRINRAKARRLDKPSFAERAMSYSWEDRPAPTNEDILGYLWMTYFIYVEFEDEGLITPLTKLRQAEIMFKFEQGREQKAKFS